MNRIQTLTRRAAALLMACCMLVLLSACGQRNETSSKTEPDTRKPAGVSEDTDLILPFSREEGVNPFSCSSQMNEAIMPLLYDGLYVINEHYEPTMSLAENLTVNGRTLMLTVNAERRFSDGTILSADDIAYSFRKAKESTYYGSLLAGIAEATASGTSTINFTLEQPNQYITANLTFPVVKAGTADQADDIPVGSGRYVYTPSEAGGVLKKSDQYKSTKFKADEIFLQNIPDQETLLNSMNIGSVYAAADNVLDWATERVSDRTTSMPLNNLVYIGIRQNGGLADASVRQALNAILDRKAMSNCFSGYLDQTDLPLNPQWYALETGKIQAMDAAKAKEQLATALTEQTLKIVATNSNTFHALLAEELAKQLKSAGVQTEVELLDPSPYRSAVSSGLYDLYIGEYRLTNDMDITGVLGDKQLASSWASVQSGASNVETFVKSFYKQMPIVTIGFREGLLAYTQNLENKVAPLPGNPFANVYDWELS